MMDTEQNNSYQEIEVDDEITFRAPIVKKSVEAHVDKENAENSAACLASVSDNVIKTAISEVLPASKMPTNLRSSWDLPSSITNQYSSKSATSFTNASVISNIRSRSSWEETTETTSSSKKFTTAPKSSWDLPSNLTRAYGNNDEHLAKYSEAEHQTLLDDAVAVVASEHEKTLEAKQAEWTAEKEVFHAKIQEMEQRVKESTGSTAKSQDLIQEAQQEAMLSKMQTKALTHRVQSLETELAEMKVQHEQQLAALAKETQEKLSANEGAMASQQKDLAVGLTSKHELQMIEKESEINKLLRKLEEQASVFKLKEDNFEDMLAEAVAEAKKHVYAKAEAQFSAGNVKYQAVKQQLKDKQAELVAAQAELETKTNALAEAVQSTKETNDALSVLHTKHDGIAKELKQLVQIINQPELAAAVGGKSITGSDYYGTKDAIAVLKTQYENNQALAVQVTELTNSKTLLETMVIEKETSLIELSAEQNELKSQFIHKEKELKSVQAQVEKVEKESELQLMIVAKLTTEKEAMESKLQTAEVAQTELNARCENLRNMNSELMTMIENQ